ncbi:MULTISPECIES: 50S ribosomal protein L29 [Leptospira]|uniref:Large ribosomal subunit protein uL29 n=2 Tax=Leptospira weilii TaxID=28184 RepID=A0A828YYD9_9LEPT|nr:MULTISPECIES: 50S ribosomal protein L29 [Leptospira]EKR63573.1 ribosomal protein L29 [Leptospira weilii str. 2006001853]EMJ65187.1 ribosomal protein L29 [Leptospira sp. P2653]EMN46385.1 ribosomal protein L29 [Leptospira weilii str. LNT 1234]EMN90210.1 ribosomal protein L29 [Leptospira weilii str. UI 13098]MCL8266832.1 50S ribosomal protein L29 [Leptospira weilii]
MKKIKLQELKDSEILEQLEEARKVLRNSRFQYGVARSLENPKVIHNTKKKIAKLLTIQRERQLKANPGEKKSKIFSRAKRKKKNLARLNAKVKG